MNATPEIFYFVTGTFQMLDGQPWGALQEPIESREDAFQGYVTGIVDGHPGVTAFKAERTAGDGWSLVEITDDFAEELLAQAAIAAE